MTITRGILDATLTQIAELSTKCYVKYLLGLTKDHQQQMSGLMSYLALYEYEIKKLISSDCTEDFIEFEGKKWTDLFEVTRKRIDKLWPHLEYK
jgi:hypothetical protein